MAEVGGATNRSQRKKGAFMGAEPSPILIIVVDVIA